MHVRRHRDIEIHRHRERETQRQRETGPTSLGGKWGGGEGERWGGEGKRVPDLYSACLGGASGWCP